MNKEIRIGLWNRNFFRMAALVGDKPHLWKVNLGIPNVERYEWWNDSETMERVIRCVGVAP